MGGKRSALKAYVAPVIPVPVPHYLTAYELGLLLVRLPHAARTVVALSADTEGNSHALIDSRMAYETCTIDGQPAIILVPSGRDVEPDISEADLAEMDKLDTETRHLDGQGQEEDHGH